MQSSIHRVQSYWLNLFDELRLRVPILVALNKSPLTTSTMAPLSSNASSPSPLLSLQPLLSRLVDTMRVEQAIPCSAKHRQLTSPTHYHPP